MNTEELLNDLLYNKSNKELYSIICKEFIRRFDMLVKVLTDGVSNEEEKVLA